MPDDGTSDRARGRLSLTGQYVSSTRVLVGGDLTTGQALVEYPQRTTAEGRSPLTRRGHAGGAPATTSDREQQGDDRHDEEQDEEDEEEPPTQPECVVHRAAVEGPPEAWLR